MQHINDVDRFLDAVFWTKDPTFFGTCGSALFLHLRLRFKPFLPTNPDPPFLALGPDFFGPRIRIFWNTDLNFLVLGFVLSIFDLDLYTKVIKIHDKNEEKERKKQNKERCIEIEKERHIFKVIRKFF